MRVGALCAGCYGSADPADPGYGTTDCGLYLLTTRVAFDLESLETDHILKSHSTACARTRARALR